ncbi:MAG TPA: DUF1232 domain-containing protein [Solirubrobacteraceae bacterium]|jgi:uncharacterized membrane protein YkvA (DUF1232 family)
MTLSIAVLVIALAAVAALYLGVVLWLVLAGRRTQARALAGFVPDCLILFRRLLGDPRIPRRRKLLLGALVAYLAMPVDLIPDVIPVAGQLDDAILVALVLRSLLRRSGPSLVREHWPGPESSLNVVLSLSGGS